MVKAVVIIQIGGAICIAMPSWQLLNGELSLEPIRELQFRWRAISRLIEDEELQIKENPYKLSTPGPNQTTQQAQKHPNPV